MEALFLILGLGTLIAVAIFLGFKSSAKKAKKEGDAYRVTSDAASAQITSLTGGDAQQRKDLYQYWVTNK